MYLQKCNIILLVKLKYALTKQMQKQLNNL